MADINLERKEAAGWWWWLLGLIGIALVAYLLAGSLGDDEVALEEPTPAPAATEPLPPAEPAPAEPPAAVQQFIDTCATQEPAAMGLDHEYTSRCVQALVAAIEGTVPIVAQAELGVEQAMMRARTAAEELASSPQEVDRHADLTHTAFASIAGLIDEVQDQRYPALDPMAAELSEAAAAVNPGADLLDQGDAVQRFFVQAGAALRAMAQNPGTTAA